MKKLKIVLLSHAFWNSHVIYTFSLQIFKIFCCILKILLMNMNFKGLHMGLALWYSAACTASDPAPCQQAPSGSRWQCPRWLGPATLVADPEESQALVLARRLLPLSEGVNQEIQGLLVTPIKWAHTFSSGWYATSKPSICRQIIFDFSLLQIILRWI